MKTRPSFTPLSAVLAAALLGVGLAAQPAFAQNQTDAKIRLMSEALRARDAGDLAGAQKALAQLATIAPNDPAAQRLRAEIEAAATARSQQLTAQATAAATPAPAPAPAARPAP
ncbi:MAG: hypothetical protein Q8N18_02000, partial [Opitutaceae bacterium]|nr:hypothetical protein [Opitutaceae bacterium]